jgi:hypothetical protein
VTDLAFTHDGLEPFLRSARFQYLLGNIYKGCDQPDRARAAFSNAMEQSNLPDAFWSWKASQQLPGSDERSISQKLEATLDRTRSTGETSSRTGWWLYNAALLDGAVGHTDQAKKEFHEALLHPDQLMTYHLTRLALSGNNP